MLLIAGLGNPGPKYAGNRHNVGVRAVDAIGRAHGFSAERARFQGLAREGVLVTQDARIRTLLLKPQTYMNESGRSVGAAARFYKIPPENIIVFYDEIDLAPGKFRMKSGGGAAGHNGARSVIAAIGPNFRRGRIGVGHPGRKELVHGYVLSDFHKAEEPWVEDLCDAIARSAPLLARDDDNVFQTRVTHLAPAPKPDDDETPGGDA